MSPSPEPLLTDRFLRKLDRLRLRTRRVDDYRLGEQRSRRRGQGLDFADFREYQPGDDFRHIDWNIYSRLDRLFVRLFDEEQSLSVELYLDTSRSMRPDESTGASDRFGYAQRLAAAIGYVALRNGAQLLLAPLQDATPSVSLQGRRRLPQLFSALVQYRPEGAAQLGEALRLRAAQHSRPGLCIIVSDFMDTSDWQSGVAALRAQRKHVHLLQLLRRDELAPTEVGQLALVDAESDKRLALSVDDAVLAEYRAVTQGWLEEIRTFAGAQGIVHHLLVTDAPLEQALLQALRRGGLFA